MPEHDERLDEAWKAHRAHLVDVAFRMLRDIGAAEDAVQEAYARWLQTDDEIRDDRAWLTTVTSRICLDQIRSARSRLDRSEPAEEFEATPDPATGVDPADQVTLDDHVGVALHVVLRRLSPAERVAFVMHDVFQLPFDVIAEQVGRSPSTCRQHASRARERIGAAAAGRTFHTDVEAERQVAEAFIGACAEGDLSALIALLDPGVSGDGDFGPGVPTPPIAVGAATVAQRTLRFLGQATLVVHPEARVPTLIAFIDRRPLAVIELTVVDGQITELHADGTAEALAPWQP